MQKRQMYIETNCITDKQFVLKEYNANNMHFCDKFDEC